MQTACGNCTPVREYIIVMGVAGTGFGVVLPAMAGIFVPNKRALALGLVMAADSTCVVDEQRAWGIVYIFWN